MTGREFIKTAGPLAVAAARAVAGDITALAGTFGRLAADGIYRTVWNRPRRAGTPRERDWYTASAVTAAALLLPAAAATFGTFATTVAAGGVYVVGSTFRRNAAARTQPKGSGPVRVRSYSRQVAGRTVNVSYHGRQKAGNR